jgi:hypothetical protein
MSLWSQEPFTRSHIASGENSCFRTQPSLNSLCGAGHKWATAFFRHLLTIFIWVGFLWILFVWICVLLFTLRHLWNGQEHGAYATFTIYRGYLGYTMLLE